MANKTKVSPVFLILTMATVFFDLYGEFRHERELEFYAKLLLNPFLMAYYVSSIQNGWNKTHRLMLAALSFAWLGDIALAFAPETPDDMELVGIAKNKYFFLLGVGLYLITQILFIFSYRNSVLQAQAHVGRVVFVPFVAYWVGMLLLILPPLYINQEKGPAVVPVAIYAGVVVSMAAVALARYGRTSPKSFALTFTGACIFVLSDSLIAVNFLALEKPLPFAGISIMATYIVAEWLIARGILAHFNEYPRLYSLH